MVLPPTTGAQSLEFRLSVSVLLKDFNFELSTSFPKKLGQTVDRGTVGSREVEILSEIASLKKHIF
jgi:hypothetical protein